MQISQAGTRLIQSEEALRLRPYDDHDGAPVAWAAGRYLRPDGSPCKGYPTIGWGHRIWPGQIFDEITREQADTMLLANLEDTESAVNRQCPTANQHEYDALCSFEFNVGSGGLHSSGIPDAMACGAPLDDVKGLFMAFIHSQGKVVPTLVRRRAKEFALFATPIPTIPIDVDAILSSVYETAQRETEAFRKGGILPDEPPPEEGSA